MVNYTCNRCGFTAKHKGHFKNHLERKNICIATLEDISIESIKLGYKFSHNTNFMPKIPPKFLQNSSKFLRNSSREKNGYKGMFLLL